MPDISCRIGGMRLASCVYNASGPRCVTREELEELGRSEAGAILTKSCTKEARLGNPEPRYVSLDQGSLNSMGLPNLGYRNYIELAPGLRGFTKPVMASVSGLSLPDNVEIMQAMDRSAFDAIELNLSCPNIPGKPQVGYDFQATDELLREVKKACGKPVGCKLPPYFDFVHFEVAAEVLRKHQPAFLSCINSIGNALVIDPEKEQVAIKPKGGFGGLGGRYIKYTALANVRKFYELFEGKVPIIGVGGMWTGADAFEFILAGATAVQVGTCYYEEGPACFGRIARELEQVMERKGYHKLEDFRGKLKGMA